jgi:hypothetical protein
MFLLNPKSYYRKQDSECFGGDGKVHADTSAFKSRKGLCSK